MISMAISITSLITLTFDTVVNRFLIEKGAMRPGTDEVVGIRGSIERQLFHAGELPHNIEHRASRRSFRDQVGDLVAGRLCTE